MEQRPHFQCFHPHKPQWQEAPKPQERLHVAFATTNQLQVKSAQWCLRSSGYPGRVENTGLDSWLGPYLPGDQARLHRKRGILASALSGDLWGLQEMFAQKDCLTKSMIQVSLIRRMCQSQQENPRWVFCLLPLLSLYDSTFWQLMRRKEAKNAENCSEGKIPKWIT